MAERIDIIWNHIVRGAEKVQKTMDALYTQQRKLINQGGRLYEVITTYAKPIAKSTGEVDRRYKGLGKTIKIVTREVNKNMIAWKHIRLQFLGVMFGGYRMQQMFGNMLKPIRDITGVSDLWQATLMDVTADAIDPMISMIEAGGGALKFMDKILGGNLGTMLLFGETIGGTLAGLGQMILFIDALAASFMSLPGPIGTAMEKLGVLFGTFPKAALPVKVAGVGPTIAGTVTWKELGWSTISEHIKTLGKGLSFTIGVSLVLKGLSELRRDITIGIIDIMSGAGFIAGVRYPWILPVAITIAGIPYLSDLAIDLGRKIGNKAAGGILTAIGSALATAGLAATALGLVTGPLGFAIAGGLAALGGVLSGIGAGLLAHAQEGGIFTRPTITMLAEGGRPEAVIPLEKATTTFGNVYFNVNISSTLTSDNVREVARELADVFADEMKRLRGGYG